MWSRPNQFALRSTLAYVIFAGLWIFFSDAALTRLVADVQTMSWVGTVKGLVFVAVTGLLLFGGQRRHLLRWGDEVTRRERAEAEIRASQARFRQYVEHAPLGVVVADLQGRLVDANPAGLELLGLDGATLLRSTVADIFPAGERATATQVYESFVKRGKIEGDVQLRRPDGSAPWLHFRGVRYADDRAMAFIQDITVRKAGEREIARLNRVHATLSEINACVARATSREALFRDVCAIATTQAGFKLAWIGWHDLETHRVQPLARSGDIAYLDKVEIYADDRGLGPVGACIREGRPAISNDFLAEPRGLPWHEPARAHGLRALAALPIRLGGAVRGAFAVYAGEADAFQDKEVALLGNAAENISFALDALARQEQHQHAERALHESEERFRLMAQTIGEVFWLSPPDFAAILYVSPAFEKIWGRPCAEVHADARIWLDAIVAEDGPRVARAHRELASGTAYDIDFRVRHKDGTVRWINDRGYPLRDASGRVFLASGVASDITDRKRADEELRKLSQAVEQSPAAIVITDVAGSIEYVNPKFTQVTGFSADEVRGKTPRVLKSGETPAHEYQRLWATITGGGEWRGVFHNRRKNGELYWEQATISPIVDDEGRIGHFLAVKEDVSERRAADQALRESEDRFRALVDNVPAGLFVQVDGRFAFANGHAVRLFGADGPAALLGQPVMDRLHPDVRESVRERLRLLGEEGRAVPLTEEQCLRLDGTIFDAEMSAVPFVHAGKGAALVAIRDIGERKRLEAQLRQAQKLEAIGTLAGGVAHDFNNLLTVIQGNATVMLMPDANPAEQRELGEEILGAAQRAAGLTRQLLLFSRKQSMQPVNLDLNDVVTNLARMLRRILGEDITFQTECASQLPMIHGDIGMIEQVLVNLAANSRDAMPRGGRLTIATARVHIDAGELVTNPEATAGPAVCLSVTDTGEGIPESVMQHIFEPFFTTKGVGQGTGLGLATAYGIVKQHRGWITATSPAGDGTTFRVFFPAADGARKDDLDVGADPIRLPRGGETILLVEDDESVRRAVAAILERCGYTVLHAATGVAALEVWHHHGDRIQLLLTDLVMPDRMNGIALAEHLLAERPDLRVLYTSGYSAGHSSDVPLVDGVNFLQKPYDAEKLADVVRRRLDAGPAMVPTQ